MCETKTNIVQDFPDEMEKYLCPRCQCCEMDFVECTYCGGEGGIDGDELIMEDPMWYDENDYRTCDACKGKGGHYECIGNCDKNGKHI